MEGGKGSSGGSVTFNLTYPYRDHYHLSLIQAEWNLKRVILITKQANDSDHNVLVSCEIQGSLFIGGSSIISKLL